jgi:hypothetical protein
VYDPDVVLGVDIWTYRQWGVGYERDPNGAINLEKLGLAEAQSTRRDMAPLLACGGYRRVLRMNREP